MKSLSLNQPHLIIMVGVPGSGKTFFAEKFADTFHAPYVSYEKLAGLVGGSDELVGEVLYYHLTELLKTRQSILIEGVADTRAQRLELNKLARTAGYETVLVWVQTEPSAAKSRYLREKKQHGAVSPQEYDKLVEHFAQPTAVEKPIVISGKHTYATQAKIILKKLSGPRAEIVSQSHVTSPARSETSQSSSQRRNITIR